MVLLYTLVLLFELVMLKISPIPAFNDNYIWVIEFTNSNDIIAVDPGDAKPLLEYIKTHSKQLVSILITHHHYDHVGGVDKLLKAFDAPVYGPANSPFSESNVKLSDGEHISVKGLNFDVLSIPGHTLDHIAYYCREYSALFCGDTLFAGGCGRVFEGTYDQMYQSLLKLKAMPIDTNIYCAHEYTMANLAFALAVEPDNKLLQKRYHDCAELRKSGLPTLPSSIEEEKATNPFLRASNAEEFAQRRQWKDTY